MIILNDLSAFDLGETIREFLGHLVKSIEDLEKWDYQRLGGSEAIVGAFCRAQKGGWQSSWGELI